MKAYRFRQNNSGGWFYEPAINVIVVAYNKDQAIDIAMQNGIYFHGVAMGKDCSCCGDRWSAPDEYDTKEQAIEWSSGYASEENIPKIVVYEL